MLQENINSFKEYLEEVKLRMEQNGCFKAAETEPYDPWAWIPKRYRDAAFENFETGKDSRKINARNAIRDHVRHENQLWIGGNGTGKTRFAYCCVKAYGAKYRELYQLFRQIKNDWEGEAYIIRELVEAPILILDEAGRSSRSDWEQQILFQIVNGRYNARGMRPTVFSANCTIEEIEAYLGNAIIDRLQWAVVPFNWESFRARESNHQGG